MEEDARDILSPLLSRVGIKDQIKRLEQAVEVGQQKIDFATANDPNVRKAIDIVERFLRKKQRVCYGGQAINALLPKSRQFYDPTYAIPDYDFFTPSYKEDTDIIINSLKEAGFDNVHKKLSVHKGTIKILVNFTPIADCTDMDPGLFKHLQERAKSVDGILYADADFLRMMMYLELS